MINLPIISNRFTGKIKPDDSVSEQEFIQQYEAHSERWEKAFAFIRDTDLKSIAKGRHELEGNDLYASIDEYTTKNEEDARFEAHRKYADIQYVISGEEIIGILPLDKTEMTTPYNAEKDICFLKSSMNHYRHATPDRYFIFFPHDAHRPCVKKDDNTPVRKVVVKVKL
jgi:YhcH/YjgK/YiaL family protein